MSTHAKARSWGNVDPMVGPARSCDPAVFRSSGEACSCGPQGWCVDSTHISPKTHRGWGEAAEAVEPRDLDSTGSVVVSRCGGRSRGICSIIPPPARSRCVSSAGP